MSKITYRPIGVIHSPFKDVEGMPVQPAGASGIEGTVELSPDLAPGLKDLDGFSHIILTYHFHLSEGYSLHVKPFLDDALRGVFATRAPRRPNAIGLSIVKLIGITGNVLHVRDIDVLDGTPLLDIKPFVPQFDNRNTDKIGWVTGKASIVGEIRADRRFRDRTEE